MTKKTCDIATLAATRRVPALAAATMETQAFASVAELLAFAAGLPAAIKGEDARQGGRQSCSPSAQRVRLGHPVSVLQMRRWPKSRSRPGKLCLLTVSDPASAGAELTLRIAAACNVGSRIQEEQIDAPAAAPGELAPAAAASAIGGCFVGAQIGPVEGLLGHSREGIPVLSCDFVCLGTGAHADGGFSDARPTLIFDLNYAAEMTDGEFDGLCRQLRLCYTANRRSAHAFRIVLAGLGLSPPARSGEPPSPLWVYAQRERWDRWAGVELRDDVKPWQASDRPDQRRQVVYLAAESPYRLDSIHPGATIVIGGLVDHSAKPGLSYERATCHGLTTARLPLGDAIAYNSRGGQDITTLAVVQLLLLRQEYRADESWGDAISHCPALRCAPLRKYVRWKKPYESLNDAPPPHEIECLDSSYHRRKPGLA
jgi:hypothetical protein